MRQTQKNHNRYIHYLHLNFRRFPPDGGIFRKLPSRGKSYISPVGAKGQHLIQGRIRACRRGQQESRLEGRSLFNDVMQSFDSHFEKKKIDINRNAGTVTLLYAGHRQAHGTVMMPFDWAPFNCFLSEVHELSFRSTNDATGCVNVKVFHQL